MAQHNSLIHLFAGGMGGTVGAIVTCPLEVVKTRLQSSCANFDAVAVNRHQPSAISSVGIAHQHATNRIGIVRCLKTILEQEGARALWKGLVPNLVGVLPSRAIYFFTYHHSKNFLAQRFSKDSSLVHMAAAFCAGFSACTATNPIWLIKTRVQLDRSRAATGSKFTVLQCIKLVYKESGVKGFYKGITASYYGISETMVHFVIYEYLKKVILTRNRELEGRTSDEKKLKDYGLIMVAAACSKTSASAICYPHEVARTRLREPGRKYRHFWQTLQVVFQEEGRRGLYRGLGTQLLRQLPNTAIMMATYEGIVYILGGKTEVSEPVKKSSKKKRLESKLHSQLQDRSNRESSLNTNSNSRSAVTVSVAGVNIAHHAYSSLPLSASGPSNGVITVSTDTSITPKNSQKDATPASPRNNDSFVPDDDDDEEEEEDDVEGDDEEDDDTE